MSVAPVASQTRTPDGGTIVAATQSLPAAASPNPTSCPTLIDVPSGKIRRECLDHVVALGEGHVRRLLANYQAYDNSARTHLALDKDAPLNRPPQTVGKIASIPWLGGLHGQYTRMA